MEPVGYWAFFGAMMKVLLVDDSKSARYALRSMLGKKGLEVVMAESGEEALELLHDNPVDLVLMDQSMPGIGGIEATRRIKSDPATADLPVVLCTSAEGEAFEREAEEAGAMAILSKPPAMEQLQRIIGRLEHGGSETAAEEPAPTASAAIDSGEIKRQLESDLGLWLQESLDNALDDINTRLRGLVARIETLEAYQAETRAALDNLPDASALKAEVSTFAEQQVGGLGEELRAVLAEHSGTIENIGQRIENLPSPMDLDQPLDELRLSLNQQIGELKDRQNGLANEVAARARAEIEDSERRMTRKFHTLLGVTFAVLAAAIAAVTLF